MEGTSVGVMVSKLDEQTLTSEFQSQKDSFHTVLCHIMFKELSKLQ